MVGIVFSGGMLFTGLLEDCGGGDGFLGEFEGGGFGVFFCFPLWVRVLEGLRWGGENGVNGRKNERVCVQVDLVDTGQSGSTCLLRHDGTAEVPTPTARLGPDEIGLCDYRMYTTIKEILTEQATLVVIREEEMSAQQWMSHKDRNSSHTPTITKRQLKCR